MLAVIAPGAESAESGAADVTSQSHGRDGTNHPADSTMSNGDGNGFEHASSAMPSAASSSSPMHGSNHGYDDNFGEKHPSALGWQALLPGSIQ